MKRVLSRDRFVGDMTDQRIGAGTTLHLKDASHGIRVGRIRAKPVNRLGWKRDEPSCTQESRCFLERFAMIRSAACAADSHDTHGCTIKS